MAELATLERIYELLDQSYWVEVELHCLPEELIVVMPFRPDPNYAIFEFADGIRQLENLRHQFRPDAPRKFDIVRFYKPDDKPVVSAAIIEQLGGASKAQW